MAYTPSVNGGRINATIGGNTAGIGSLVSTGTMSLNGGNNVTLSQNGNAITFSAANQTVQTMGMYATGNTTQNTSATLDARSVSMNGLGAMSVGYSGGSVQLSAPAVSSVSASGIINISTAGNTVSIGAPAFSAGMSTLGNTGGTSGTASNQIIFAGGNNITLSQSTGIGGNTLSFVGPNLIGGNNITLSQNANNVTINAPNEAWLPADNGLISAAFDPASCGDNGSAPISGTIYLVAVRLRAAATITNLNVVVGVAGSGLTVNRNYLGLYSSTGTRLAQTGNMATAWATAGDSIGALTSSYAAAAGLYYVAILATGTTTPTFATGSRLGANFTPGNANNTVRFARGPASQTSLPSSITMGSLVQDANNYWVGVS